MRIKKSKLFVTIYFTTAMKALMYCLCKSIVDFTRDDSKNILNKKGEKNFSPFIVLIILIHYFLLRTSKTTTDTSAASKDA